METKHWRGKDKKKTPCGLLHVKCSNTQIIFGKLVEKNWPDLCSICVEAWNRSKTKAVLTEELLSILNPPDCAMEEMRKKGLRLNKTTLLLRIKEAKERNKQ